MLYDPHGITRFSSSSALASKISRSPTQSRQRENETYYSATSMIIARAYRFNKGGGALHRSVAFHFSTQSHPLKIRIDKDLLRKYCHNQQMYDDNLDVANRLAEQDVELAQLREELRLLKEQAGKDSLTKLANRDAFLEALHSVVAIAHNNAQDLSLIMIDIDYFKTVNDTFGHLIGDLTLQAFSRLLLSSFKAPAIVARCGGEEFAVILPNTNLTEALKSAHALRNRLMDLRVLDDDLTAPNVVITISIGVAQYRETESATDLFQRADHELYIAKRQGRDSVQPTLES